MDIITTALLTVSQAQGKHAQTKVYYSGLRGLWIV